MNFYISIFVLLIKYLQKLISILFQRFFVQELINNRIVLNSEDIEVFKSPNSWKGSLEEIISICSRKNKDVGFNITPFIFDNPKKGESTKLTGRKKLRDFKSDSSKKKI